MISAVSKLTILNSHRVHWERYGTSARFVVKTQKHKKLVRTNIEINIKIQEKNTFRREN
jgi:hypothetical protein